MTDRAHTLCFTGHRELREPDYVLEQRVKEVLEPLIRYGFRDFCAGGARGFDHLAARAVLQLQESHPDIRLILILPFPDQYLQEKDWTEEEIREYHWQRDRASEVIHLEPCFSKGCYYRRNRALVDRSSVCLCYQYKNSGGTAYTTEYAEQHGLVVTNLSLF